MARYANRWPYDKNEPEAPDEKRCQFELPDGSLCGLGRYPGFNVCIFHLPEDAKRPDDIVLRFALQEAVQNRKRLWYANIQGADLSGANLQEANLHVANAERANLHGANLQAAELHGANLQGAWLTEANLQAAELPVADLQYAHLWGADLQEANLWGADLQEANLHGANLQKADLHHVANLQEADLHGANLQEANLSGAILQAAKLWNANLQKADLSGAILQAADLSGAILQGADLADVIISPDTDLDGVTWGPNNIIKLEEPDRKYPEAERVYRQIKRSYEESGDYATAGRFFVREMECKRKALPVRLRWILNIIYAFCEYGENCWRVVCAAAVVIIVFAIIHAFVGIHTTESAGVYPRDVTVVNLDWRWQLPGLDELKQLGTATYFSLVTFTTLGYGDLQPGSGIGRACAAAEAAIGAFIMALFVYCFVRKWARG